MNIALLGLGVEGQSSQKYFENHGDKVEIFDPISPAEAYAKDWSNFGLVLRSPSFPPIAQGLATNTYQLPTNPQNYDFSSQTRYFFANCPAPIIGVTGTKGKGTTCSLIAAVLREIFTRGANARRAYLVGNIGDPALDILDDLTKNDIVVYEMSSFQLWDLEKSPHIAVVLGIEPDHLNVHKDYAEYVAAKGNIARHQTENDYCVFNNENSDSQKIAELSPGKKSSFPAKGLDQKTEERLKEALDSLQILGLHNRNNATAALLAVASIFNISLTDFLANDNYFNAAKTGFAKFTGLSHRLELVREISGVKFYDSSYSTDAAALKAALESFHDVKNIFLIMGGRDKTNNEDFPEIYDILKNTPNLKTTYFIGESGEAFGTAHPELGKIIDRDSFNIAPSDDIGALVITKAISEAVQEATPGDVVLFAPAAASFDMFTNASHRGQVFQEKVHLLSDQESAW